MTDCIVKWDGGSEIINDARLGDPRVGDLLDRLAKNGAKNPSVEFVDDFLPASWYPDVKTASTSCYRGTVGCMLKGDHHIVCKTPERTYP